MISAYSPWLAAHGKLWYDDKWYRIGWVVWPQALAAVLVLWFWLTPTSNYMNASWGVPLDAGARARQLLSLRDAAKSDRKAMDTLERDARGGEMNAQFLLATLYDQDLKLSTIVAPDFDRAMDWYSKAGLQGHQLALNNLALTYSQGKLTKVDYTRACYYALRLTSDAPGRGLSLKGDCYARGLGGTRIDSAQANAAYKSAAAQGDAGTGPAQQTPSFAPQAPTPGPQAFVPPAPNPLPLNPTPAPYTPPLLDQPPLNQPPLNQPDTSTDTPWGAMAFTADGSYSTAWKAASQFEAEAKVAKQCSEFGRGGCKSISFSGQQCAALATFIGSRGRRRWQLSFTEGGTTYPEAQQAAMNRCNSDDRTRGRCQFRTAVCADGR